MTDKYDTLLNQARNEPMCFYYQKIIKAMIADEFQDAEFIKSIFLESVPTIKTPDQKKTMKSFAKDLLKDKAALKEVNAAIQGA